MKAEERARRPVKSFSGPAEMVEFLQSELDKAIALLREGKAEYAQHQPGCSGEFPPHPCKCGYGEWHGRATKYLDGER
jgi:hypothetical protein